MDKKLNNLKLLTLAETAGVLQISTRTLQRMIQQREFPAFKVGGQWRIRETQLMRWVERREGSPPRQIYRSGWAHDSQPQRRRDK